MISWLLLSACSHMPGETRERGDRVFDVVQRQGETDREFFLCDPRQNDCQPSLKTPFTADDRKAATPQKPAHTVTLSPQDEQLQAFAEGKPVALFFAFGSARLDDESRKLLTFLTRQWQATPDTVIAVRGETDGFGSQLFNDGLADKRLRAVVDKLTAAGIPKGSLLISKKARCCRRDRPNNQSLAATRGERVVLLRGKDASPKQLQRQTQGE